MSETTEAINTVPMSAQEKRKIANADYHARCREAMRTGIMVWKRPPITPEESKAKRAEYMRNYMRARYQANKNRVHE